MHASCFSKNAIRSLLRILRRITAFPAASTPWTWNTDFAVSRPIMLMLIAGGLFLVVLRQRIRAVHPIFVLAHKLREAMASSMKALRIGGEGRVAEIDGASFGGHVRPENLAADRIDRRLAENQSGKRKIVVVNARTRRPHGAAGFLVRGGCRGDHPHPHRPGHRASC